MMAFAGIKSTELRVAGGLSTDGGGAIGSESSLQLVTTGTTKAIANSLINRFFFIFSLMDMDILCGGIPSLVFRTESRSFEPMRLLFEIKRELSLGTVCQNYQFIVEQLKLIAGLNGQPTNRFGHFCKKCKNSNE